MSVGISTHTFVKFKVRSDLCLKFYWQKLFNAYEDGKYTAQQIINF